MIEYEVREKSHFGVGRGTELRDVPACPRPCQEDDSEGERNHKKLLELIQQEL